MNQWTEHMIRERLNGTFTRMLEGRSEVLEVDDDYTPSMGTAGRKLGATGKGQVPWSPAEDELLCEMRLLNRPFNEIAWLLARTEGSAKKRHRTLRVKGQVAA